MTTHSVRDGEQALAYDDGVLVVLANGAGFRPARDPQPSRSRGTPVLSHPHGLLVCGTEQCASSRDGLLPDLGVTSQASSPLIEMIDASVVQRHPDVAQRHSGPAEH